MTETAPPTQARPHAALWLIVAIAAAAGLFFAYAVWSAVGNLIQTVAFYSEAGFSLNALGWFVWLFAAVFPVLVWSVAFALGFRRRAHELALIMLVGLALVAVFWLNILSYVSLNTSSLLS
ncbi:bacitracin resistance protein [Microbacterium aurantiacum]|uniref:Bacitracin resistance protein n=1 Tax=Microbacterium aurantiacum TaxID=162393 RepID=A0AAJ2LX21_9MICO|nr:bacitracin resistance protein [Microbacterium aurantiacum]MDS0246372.1 bacitracin resistance protein [Microbacterium aurantiacum]